MASRDSRVEWDPGFFQWTLRAYSQGDNRRGVVRSEVQNVDEYLHELPEDRREMVGAVRTVILRNLAPGFEETINWGMICYEVPLSICPDTYNGQPLMYAALASQKRHLAVYLTGMYMNATHRDEFVEAYRRTGKQLDMGKSCLRFRSLDALPLDLLGKAIALYDVKTFVEEMQQGRSQRVGSQSNLSQRQRS